jgi:hypothetical protein
MEQVRKKIPLHGGFHTNFFFSGSGQQPVTGIELQEVVSSHWAIYATTGNTCDRGLVERFLQSRRNR